MQTFMIIALIATFTIITPVVINNYMRKKAYRLALHKLKLTVPRWTSVSDDYVTLLEYGKEIAIGKTLTGTYDVICRIASHKACVLTDHEVITLVRHLERVVKGASLMSIHDDYKGSPIRDSIIDDVSDAVVAFNELKSTLVKYNPKLKREI